MNKRKNELLGDLVAVADDLGRLRDKLEEEGAPEGVLDAVDSAADEAVGAAGALVSAGWDEGEE